MAECSGGAGCGAGRGGAEDWGGPSCGPGPGRAGRSGRRKHWKLPDMIQGVRHRFRDKIRNKSAESEGGLPRTPSILSQDYGFSAGDWAGGDVAPRPPPRTRQHPLPTAGELSDSEFARPAYRRSGPVRAASVTAVHQTGLQSGPPSQRAKSVRFGENRISVFLQDSTQALEECVRLALVYAEETQQRDSQCCSDSEAVQLSRRLAAPEQGSGGPGPRWRSGSDTEERARQAPPDRPTSQHNGLPGGGTAHSLDRANRLAEHSADRERKKRSTQINEIFSFIDKVLSGCDNGCSGEGCPFVRGNKPGSFHYGNELPTNIISNNNFSQNTFQYQNKKSASFPRGSTVDSCAYRGKLTTGGRLSGGEDSFHNSRLRSLAGLCSDSDCDTSTSSAQPLPGSAVQHSAALNTDKLTKRTTEDVFAKIIVCSESNKENLGMPKYEHIHQKISQTVCNAIFLCKVLLSLVKLRGLFY